MKPEEIRTWVLEIVACVQANTPAEDSRVECKVSWVEPKSIARQIAAQANAALGENILWLIGVDEKGRAVPGASQNELANWYPQLKKEFDQGIAPALVANINIAVGCATVVALLFDTTSAPFVVKVQNTDRLEIPWREGTRTRSATRFEVTKLLSVLQSQGTLLPVREFVTDSSHAQRLALERPRFWEYLLTIELLKTGLREIRRQYDEVTQGLVFRKKRKLSGREFTNLAQEKMSDLVSLLEIFTSCVEKEIPTSWGPPGQPGDALEIKRSVSRLISGCDELVEWESEIVSLEPPPIFERTKSLMRGLTSQILAELERFLYEFSKPFEQPNPRASTSSTSNLIFRRA